MRFTITPNVTAFRMSGHFSSGRMNSYGKVPAALRTSTKTSKVSGQFLSKSDVRSAVNDILNSDSTSSKDNSSWKDSYLEQVRKQAEKDYTAGVRMGKDYQNLTEEAMNKYMSSSRNVTQKLFQQESDGVYTEAWNAAKEAAQKASSTTESTGFDKKV